MWLVVASCAKVSNDADYDHTIDLTAFETYAWRQAGEEVQPERHDFRVNLLAVVEEPIDVDAYGATLRPAGRERP